MEPFVWNYILEKDLDEEDDSSINEDDSVQSLHRSPTSPLPLTAVSAAAITLVRASSLINNNMSKLYPNLSHALGDDDGFFDPTDPLVDKPMRGLLKELNHLLTAYQLLALMSAKFLRSFFGDWYLQRFLSVVSV